MSAPTPGPWHVLDGDSIYFGACELSQQIWSERFRVGFVEAQNVGRDVAAANADLIAAAPDLYAAANKARTALARLAMSVVMGNVVGKDLETAVNEAQDALNAAVAKAEGR